ncbi:hypothetical protein CQ045_00895 [Microbacterium sp. MYb66]|nr:hypothetical protein CQ045_00895 [Microbacterium sp. MYb66]
MRWGDFTLTGTLDAHTGVFAVDTVTPASAAPTAIEEEPLFPSRCPVPDGGWEVLDESTATGEALHAANSLIPTLEGYATAWIDRSQIPPAPPGADAIEQMRFDAVHAGLSIVNVGVRGDPSAAEVAVRRVWGGALCVFTVDYAAADIEALQQRIMHEHPVFSSAIDPMTGVIGLTVTFDADGELQLRMDREYGPGRVAVWPVLVPL